MSDQNDLKREQYLLIEKACAIYKTKADKKISAIVNDYMRNPNYLTQPVANNACNKDRFIKVGLDKLVTIAEAVKKHIENNYSLRWDSELTNFVDVVPTIPGLMETVLEALCGEWRGYVWGQSQVAGEYVHEFKIAFNEQGIVTCQTKEDEFTSVIHYITVDVLTYELISVKKNRKIYLATLISKMTKEHIKRKGLSWGYLDTGSSVVKVGKTFTEKIKSTAYERFEPRTYPLSHYEDRFSKDWVNSFKASRIEIKE